MRRTESENIAWLREQVAKSTTEDRASSFEMARNGDLNEGYIAGLLEAAEELLTLYDYERSKR